MSTEGTRTMDAATLWRTRVTWALVGAGAALAITSLLEPSGGDAARATEAVDAPADPRPASVPPTATPATNPTVPLAADVAMPIASEPPPEPVAIAPARVPEPTAIAEPAAAPAPVPAAPFEIPLPKMPGARVMKRGQAPDPEHGGTIHTLSLSVPAPGMQVEQFYRSALADAKLVVSGGSGEPTSIGSGHRSSLRGRGRGATVHVNLRQPAGKLRTIVRIIWRALP